MFTGLIKDKANVKALEESQGGLRLFVLPSSRQNWERGESIALNGICLTLVQCDDGVLCFDISPETRQKTTIDFWRNGDEVNLERALRMGDSLGGHFVQGHIDGVGVVQSIEEQGSFWKMNIRVPSEAFQSLMPKGSIAIDGVSLTINAIHRENSEVELQLIPETLALTNLKNLKVGSKINFELDMMAKAFSQFASSAFQLFQGDLPHENFKRS